MSGVDSYTVITVISGVHFCHVYHIQIKKQIIVMKNIWDRAYFFKKGDSTFGIPSWSQDRLVSLGLAIFRRIMWFEKVRTVPVLVDMQVWLCHMFWLSSWEKPQSFIETFQMLSFSICVYVCVCVWNPGWGTISVFCMGCGRPVLKGSLGTPCLCSQTLLLSTMVHGLGSHDLTELLPQKARFLF